MQERINEIIDYTKEKLEQISKFFAERIYMIF